MIRYEYYKIVRGKNLNLETKFLESRRLILRKITIDDAKDMYNNWSSDPQCCRFLSWDVHKNVEETENLLVSWVNAYDFGALNWVIELKDTHEIIGSIFVIILSKKHNTAEVAYCYGARFWNKGYATEVLRRINKYTKERNDSIIYSITKDDIC